MIDYSTLWLRRRPKTPYLTRLVVGLPRRQDAIDCELQAMHALSVRLFGQFSVCCGDKAFEHLIPSKANELLCYLLTHRQRPLGREFLANVLWGDCTTEHSKQYLRKALWQLHRALGLGEPEAAGPILQANSQWVSLSSEADVWVDVAEFEGLYSTAQKLSSEDGSCRKVLEAAVELYRGDLLEGWYQDWCLYDRERLQNMYLVILGKVIACAEGNHEYEKGIDYATRILKCDRAHEIAHQHIMRLRYLSGDRAGALRQYESCAFALKQELGVQPSEHTRQLYRKICQDKTPGAANGAEQDLREPRTAPSLLEGALNRLAEVKTALGALQNAVDDSLERVREALQVSNHGSDR